MRSRDRTLVPVVLALLAGSVAVRFLSGLRPSRRQARQRTGSPQEVQPRKLEVRTSSVVFTGLVLAALAGTIWGGYEVKWNRARIDAARALTGGEPDRGRTVMVRYGCAGCHTIPGVRGAQGHVGPNLAHVGDRLYIGGVVTNTPDNLVRWIVNPRAIDPKTAMPVTGVTPDEARDAAAYLYSL
jgi:cytochrome c2